MIIQGLGRLGRDPEMQYTPAGTAQTKFSVACTLGYGDKKETAWVNLIAWGAVAETYNKYLAKGSRVVFNAEVTRVSGYTKRDETIGVNLDAKILSLEFVDGIEKQEASDEPEEF